MRISKRAILYLIRKKGRSLLLFIIILLLSCFILVGKALSQNAQNEIDKIAMNLGSSFVLKADENNPAFLEERIGEKYVATVYVGPLVTDQLISEILELDHVSDWETTRETVAWADLKLRPALWAQATADELISQEAIELERQMPGIYACTNGELSRNFRIGAFSLTSGRNIQKEDQSVALISEYLAGENHLTVGDTIILETRKGVYEECKDPFERIGEPLELEIIGIFSPNFEQEPSIFTAESVLADNFVYIDFETERQLRINMDSNLIDSYGEVTFFADAPEYLPEIMRQIEEQIDIEDLLLNRDDTAYQASIKPLKQIRIISFVLAGVGIVGCAWILYLIFVMWTKGRRQEMGILLSIGVDRKRILMQMIMECFIITTLALGAAIALSKPLINGCGYLAEEQFRPDSQTETYEMDLNVHPTPVIEKVSSEPVRLESYVSVYDIVFLMIATYCISLGSVWIAAARITRFSPKELLQSMR